MPRHLDVWVCGYLGVGMLGCQDVWWSGRLGVRMSGGLEVWLSGFLGVRMHECWGVDDANPWTNKFS